MSNLFMQGRYYDNKTNDSKNNILKIIAPVLLASFLFSFFQKKQTSCDNRKLVYLSNN